MSAFYRQLPWCFAAALLLASATPSAFAQSPPSEESIWARSHLTGDWWGTRSCLQEKGVTLDLHYTSFYQGLLSGAGDKDFDYGGKLDLFLDLDGGKMGLWEGGGFHTHLEYSHGSASPNLGGALFSQNLAMLYPVDTPGELVATSVYLSQKLGERAEILLGKINPVDLLAKEQFYGGWGTQRFMNLALVAPPSGLIPPVFIGAVARIKTEPVTWILMAFDPNDHTADYFPDRLFADGVNFAFFATHNGRWLGRRTTFAFGALYSTAEGVDYSTIGSGLQTSNLTGAYNLSLRFAHNLQESTEHPDASWGFHLKVAIADGNPNYVQSSIVGGIAGNPLFFGRPQDRFGLGAFYYNLSNDLQDALAAADFGDEAGVELFYTWSVTPWFHLTGDIQAIKPARRGDETAVIASLRCNLRF